MTDAARSVPDLFGENDKGHEGTVRILDLLEKLAAAESLQGAAAAAGVREDQMRAGLRQAASLIRREGTPADDWRELSVAEALSILADHGIGQGKK
ncbi:molybdopterin oxidoreductase [Rhodomicrobium vannielii ATCC 17100]|jgi:hypothetical protein|uniref:Molybdopterin oxidoreductase n=1 Tax=Rhodomicrobium vannielii (strain ATCC 17100 / DSM 162 / LMG 4299 / NCIMB 10020 / ATH 3.1.1) TaxID=648757 RepID=E3I221_RHOVT|nr:hypothetical protein [Rhodomicrobium vannielii]ADP71322.1 molybdopterin oxidoreductase [Rhodomicrobium vannielii ATCC 17100]